MFFWKITKIKNKVVVWELQGTIISSERTQCTNYTRNVLAKITKKNFNVHFQRSRKRRKYGIFLIFEKSRGKAEIHP